jgi:hypothetical protein
MLRYVVLGLVFVITVNCNNAFAQPANQITSKNSGVVISPKYDLVDSFSEGLARVLLNDKYGFIDQSRKEVIPLKYDLTFDFSEGLARVKLNDKYGFIDKNGKEIIPLKYDEADWDFIEDLARVKLNGKWGHVDKNGNETWDKE